MPRKKIPKPGMCDFCGLDDDTYFMLDKNGDRKAWCRKCATNDKPAKLKFRTGDHNMAPEYC